MQALKDWEEDIPAKDIKEVSRLLKEKHCYCSADIVKEHQKFDQKSKDASGNWVQNKWFKTVNMTAPLT